MRWFVGVVSTEWGDDGWGRDWRARYRFGGACGGGVLP